MRVVAYVRVSTVGQVVDGHGLEVQEQAIRAWCREHGHRLVGVHRDEGVSGSHDVGGRDGLADALATLEARQAAGIAVYALDRLARRLTVQEAVLARVWDHGGTVFSILDGGEVAEDDPDDPMRAAMRQMRGVFAELDRAMVMKRLRDGRAVKRGQGGYAGDGAPPFGWRSDAGELVPVPDEQATLARMAELRAEGASLQQIADALSGEGRPSRRSTRWHPTTVARALARLGDNRAAA